MNAKSIRALAEVMRDCGLTALELREGETLVRLERAAPMPAAMAPAVRAGETELGQAMPEPPGEALYEVRSPMVGVYYSAPGPEVEPFVTLGAQVKQGDVLCILEAMKLMNEIVADRDGEVAEICVKNGDVTEFGQVLFRLR